MKIAVVGAGSVGGYFGGRLAAGGHDVSFVAQDAHLAALRHAGLIAYSVAGDFTVMPVHATDDTREIGAVDAVLLGVKTWQLVPAITALEPLIDADTSVVTLQNGVEAPDLVADTIGRHAVLPGLAKIFASLDGPGRIRHIGGPASLTFAEWDNSKSARVQQLQDALSSCGVATIVPSDIWAELWSKFLFVVPFGGLGAVTDAPIGTLRTRPGMRELLIAAMWEIHNVGTAMGIVFNDDVIETSMAFIDQQPAAGTSSLQRDIQSGQPSELEAWTGAVVRLGHRTGIKTPVNSMLYELISTRIGQADSVKGVT